MHHQRKYPMGHCAMLTRLEQLVATRNCIAYRSVNASSRTYRTFCGPPVVHLDNAENH